MSIKKNALTQKELNLLISIQKSIRALLHQAAAGITPKRDDLFIDTLFSCEQATILSQPTLSQ